jgi:hypothetical protein
VKYVEDENLAKKLDFHFRNKPKWTLELNQPYQATVKTRRGEYRKRAFIGSEEFHTSSAYLGKRQGVIVVFTPAMPSSDYAYIEIPLKDCLNVLRDFPLKLDLLLETLGDESLLKDPDAFRARKQAALDREAELAANAVWGTW